LAAGAAPRHPPRLTLAGLFVLTVLAVTVLAGATLYGFVEISRRSIVERSITLRDEAARRVEQRLSREIGIAKSTVEDLERAMQLRALAPTDAGEIEAHLFLSIVDSPSLSDATFTRASWHRYDANGDAVLEPGPPWQISVFRVSGRHVPGSAGAWSKPDGEASHVDTRRVSLEGSRFVADVRSRPPGGALLSADFRREEDAPGPPLRDPTLHDTFRTTANEAYAGVAIWTDLAYSEIDANLPPRDRRVIMTVQKAVEDTPHEGTPHHFAGVVRVGLLASTIDTLPGLGTEGPGADARVVFLCDAQGRLVSRLDRSDPITVLGDDDLRVAPSHLPPVVAAALSSQELRQVTAEHPEQNATLAVGGMRYLASFRSLCRRRSVDAARCPETQDWVVAVVAPEAFYTRDLSALRDGSFVVLLLGTILVLIGGAVVVRQVARGLGRIGAETSKMRRFDFAPSSVGTAFRDVADVVDGLERAKTAMRALGKYVPVDLVRTLYASNQEPVLGGELLEISLMFTDIRGFTDLSERLSPDALAQALGHYLKAMSRAVGDNHGTVDKFIGDAVMAFWNAPSRLPDHPRWACAGALACIRATRELYASPDWSGLDPLFTRFGLHKDRVMVGHFGAPDRLSYTALGDGVNLAARLESLCKQYGVAILASEAMAASVRAEFEFRLVDKVAVKGKTAAVRVYELLGMRGECEDRKALVSTYERALHAYFERDFAAAIDLLEPIHDDGPAETLRVRCQGMLVNPPPAGWDGVYVATSK
jgi:adenylate cyclase